MKIYCITHKPNEHISKLGLIPFGVGLSNFPDGYLTEKNGENISHKNNNYSETSFHYWYWKNILKTKPKNEWFGMCQYRRYFVKYEYKDLIKYSDGYQGFYPNIKKISDLKKMLQLDTPDEWNKYDIILCEPWSVTVKSKTKLFKRGFKSIIKDPLILFNKKKQNIKLHFDMHHGYGILEKASKELKEGDRDEFLDYVSNNSVLNPHIMFIAKKKILNKWFIDCFEWLFKCEKLFGFDNLTGYDKKRLYAFLAERYLSFWFHKYARPIAWHWAFYDIEKEES